VRPFIFFVSALLDDLRELLTEFLEDAELPLSVIFQISEPVVKDPRSAIFRIAFRIFEPGLLILFLLLLWRRHSCALEKSLVETRVEMRWSQRESQRETSVGYFEVCKVWFEGTITIFHILRDRSPQERCPMDCSETGSSESTMNALTMLLSSSPPSSL
jgi:hypothetical protein